MKIYRICYHLQKIMIVVFICGIAAVLIKSLHYVSFLPYQSKMNVSHFFDGVWGVFLYLLPLFMIWFLPFAIKIDGYTEQSFGKFPTFSFHLFGGFILSTIFSFIFGNEFASLLFLLYAIINTMTSIVFYRLNHLVNKFFRLKC